MSETSPDPPAVARVLLDSPLPQLDHLFDYRIPDRLLGQVPVGSRVRVPLRTAGRLADAFVVDTVARSDIAGELSELDTLISTVPVLSQQIYALARAVADRSAGSAADVLRLAIPKRQVRVEKLWLAERSTPDGCVADPDPAPQTSATGTVDGYPAELAAAVAAGERLSVAAIPELVQAAGSWVGRWAVTATQLALRELHAGRSAILVVPDYRDQDQLEAVLSEQARAGAVLRVDARQPAPDRYRSFLAALEGEPRIIVGNRSAIYSPVRTLGLILVWNDGDGLYAEPLAPYANLRDVALLRQEQSGCALVFLGSTRSTAVQRLTELGWLRPMEPTVRSRPRVVLTPADSDAGGSRSRIPSAAWQAASAALDTGPVLVQVARPGSAALHAVQHPNVSSEVPAIDAGRTAHELGRAFPGTRVLISDGERPLLTVPADPALIIATRGAEPIAAEGYRAVLLLDGERMLLRESVRVAEDCLRWWSNAAALAAPGAPVHLVGVEGDLATALATWRQADFAARQLRQRRQLRLPPAVRIASLTGSTAEVTRAAELAATAGAQLLLTEDLDQGVRTVLRFDYSAGPAVAATLRSCVLRNAAGRRSRTVRERGFAPPPTLRVRLDDPDAL